MRSAGRRVAGVRSQLEAPAARTRSARVGLAILALALISGCADPVSIDGLPEPSLDVFVAAVEPLLVMRCGNPSGCHGREDRPFALYAPRANRIDPASVFLDEPLSERESLANYWRSVAFGVRVDDAEPLLLSKPLARSAGGSAHRGGPIWVSRDEREYRVLAAWLAGEDP